MVSIVIVNFFNFSLDAHFPIMSSKLEPFFSTPSENTVKAYCRELEVFLYISSQPFNAIAFAFINFIFQKIINLIGKNLILSILYLLKDFLSFTKFIN